MRPLHGARSHAHAHAHQRRRGSHALESRRPQLPNETGKTRLSLDFRVVPRSRFLDEYPGSHMRDGSSRFGIGGFFAVLDAADGDAAPPENDRAAAAAALAAAELEALSIQ